MMCRPTAGRHEIATCRQVPTTLASRGGGRSNFDESVNQFAEHNYNKCVQCVRSQLASRSDGKRILYPLSAVMLLPDAATMSAISDYSEAVRWLRPAWLRISPLPMLIGVVLLTPLSRSRVEVTPTGQPLAPKEQITEQNCNCVSHREGPCRDEFTRGFDLGPHVAVGGGQR